MYQSNKVNNPNLHKGGAVKLELGFRQKINFEFRMIYFGYISEEPQFRLNLG